MGRPRIAEELRKNWTHSVNFYDAEYRSIARWCAKQGIAISHFLREAAMEKLKRDKEAAT
ncbi:hypothetical protein M0Q28_05470 [Patescibacteria group bacterium]|jgi:hypothetical protein|nr:hypothetical protein [Patescibacteria group bacterium]